MLRKILAFALALSAIAAASAFTASAGFEVASEIKSAILVEPVTGTVLYERDADERLPPASVTKIMTALLVMEAIDGGRLSYDDTVTVSANASGMGGSQIFLEVGEKIKVGELLEGMMVASGNDAAVAFAEAVGGTEQNFVDMMNEKAASLGMENTHFMNCHGLDEDGHYTSARDIAIMSAELINKHPDILRYSSVWTDTIRGGKTALANTNKLVRFYDGCDGLKTGSTSVAKCCISATARKGEMRLIAVVMAAPTTEMRFAAVRQMFDYGFAIRELASIKSEAVAPIKVTGGARKEVAARAQGASALVGKGVSGKIEYVTEIEETLAAPVRRGQVVGKVTAKLDGKELFSCAVVSEEEVGRVTLSQIFKAILSKMWGR